MNHQTLELQESLRNQVARITGHWHLVDDFQRVAGNWCVRGVPVAQVLRDALQAGRAVQDVTRLEIGGLYAEEAHGNG